MPHRDAGHALVSLVKVSGEAPYASFPEIHDAVRRALDLLGGLESVVSPGDTVVIKPNLVRPMRYETGATTNPGVLQSLINLARECGAGRVTIAEGCESGMDTGAVFTATGVDALAQAEGAQLVDLKKDEPVAVTIPGARLLRRVFIPRTVFAADVIINVPVMKTHAEFPATLGLKNMKGILYDADKRKLHRKGLAAGIVDLYRALPPDLTVADGTVAMEGFGPVSGDPVHLGLIAASTDTVACDAVCCAVMGIDPLDVQYIAQAFADGLGQAALERIQIAGESVASVRRPFRRRTFVDVIESGLCDIVDQKACSGCRNALATLMNELEKTGGTDRLAGLRFVMGQVPAGVPESAGTSLVFIGKCQRRNVPPGARYFHGCPPGGIRIAREVKAFPRRETGGEPADTRG